jgi:rfaE bifunctional protein nucleotidyltransferase chain/domain
MSDNRLQTPNVLGEDVARLQALGLDAEPMARAALALAGALRAGGKLLTFGNGGSAADAQHVAAELIGRFEIERRGLPAVALTTDSSALTAIGNDFGFDAVFARQVQALGRRGDVALAISTSGSSPNVLAAVEVARRAGMTTIGLCGVTNCALCRRVDIPIVAARVGTASVQEAHLAAEHVLCRALERLLFADAHSRGEIPPGSILSLEELLALRDGWFAAGRVVVWTNGCFDLVHVGHLASLESARALGDLLVVGINSDHAVRRLKGEGRPLMNQEDRARLLTALRPVDYVVVFDEDTPEAVLSRVRPDIHCKGAEYEGPTGKPIPEQALVESYGGRVAFLPLIPRRSTTELVAGILNARHTT